jgi:hypothetical protein
MSYRPICDVWILARSKVPYYGAFPAGFLHRARTLLGVSVEQPVLHVCAGKVRDYPYRGLGLNDYTMDLDPVCEPDFLQDAREPLPQCPLMHNGLWPAILIDRPYTKEDADHYAPGKDVLPPINDLLKNALRSVPELRRVGVIDYIWPHPGKLGQEVAVVAVGTGRNNRARWFTVFERVAGTQEPE